MTPSITLLGPQRRPTLDRVLGVAGRRRPGRHRQRRLAGAGVATTPSSSPCSAGAAVNLRLYARWMDVLEADPEYAAAEREHRPCSTSCSSSTWSSSTTRCEAVAAVSERVGRRPRTPGEPLRPTR